MVSSRTPRRGQSENDGAAPRLARRMFSRTAIVGLMLTIFTLVTTNVSQACPGTDDPTPPVTQISIPHVATNSVASSSVSHTASNSVSCCGHCQGASFGSCCPACSAGMLVGSWAPLHDDVLRAEVLPARTRLTSTAFGKQFRPPRLFL